MIEPKAEFGKVLLEFARFSIYHGLGIYHEAPKIPPDPRFLGKSATFVTLTKEGQLRGCIGSLEAHKPLINDVHDNAVAAALRDSRFSPVTADELGQIKIEVSLLSKQTPLNFVNELDLCRQLRPNIDGVVFQVGTFSATYLPQVWEQIPDPQTFINQLKQKAGLPATFWSPKVAVSVYQVEKWQE